MRSIRLSITVYFLVVVSLALATVSWFVYQTTRQTLHSKKESTRALLQTQADSSRRAAEHELDGHLLRRAQTLANLARSQWTRGGSRELYALGVLTGGLNPCGQVLAPLWLAEGVDGPLAHRLHLLGSMQILLADEVLTRDPEGHNGEYFQIYSAAGAPLQRSRSLGDDSFTLDPVVRAKLDLLDWRFDDTTLPSGVHVRRISLKAPVSRARIRWPPYQAPARRPGPSPRHPARVAPPRFTDRTSPAIFIQCAHDTRQQDQTLAGIDEQLQADLANLDVESDTTLADLRWRLLWIGLATFAATLAGGLWLVRLGTSPLQHLSLAVGRVSEKNFHLEVDTRRLPRELQPIVDRLTQTLALLQRAFAREKQAAADISHELRTPVTTLLTTTEVALRKPRTPEEYREVLEDCRSSTQQMSQLVERLLALARLDAGVDTLRPRAVDVAGLAEQCAALVRPLADAHGLRVTVSAQRPADMTADPDKLREVLNNLLHNAIQYNRPEGTVTLTVERHDGHLCLQVCDTGVGIAPEAREHIFERFYRADASRQSDGLHAGLGLAITRSYVELMGGTIAVESTPGRGSTFRVELPG